jgi:hypothetical protein
MVCLIAGYSDAKSGGSSSSALRTRAGLLAASQVASSPPEELPRYEHRLADRSPDEIPQIGTDAVGRDRIAGWRARFPVPRIVDVVDVVLNRQRREHPAVGIPVKKLRVQQDQRGAVVRPFPVA